MLDLTLRRAPRALALATDGVQDWLSTGYAVSSVLTSIVVYDVVQRVAWRFGPDAQQDASRAMARSINRGARRSGATIRVRGLENVDQTKNYIVVSNHQSLLDISLLTEHLGKLNPRYVSKVELARGVPGVSYNLRRGGSALINRKDPAQSKAAIADLTRRVRDEGVTAVIFPEGTRSKTGAMKPFKTGGLKELVRGAPNTLILPVTSYGGSELFSRNMKPLVRGVELGMVFHKPMAAPPASLGDEAFTAFTDELQRVIASGLPQARN